MSYDLHIGEKHLNITFNVAHMARALGIYEGLFNHGWEVAFEAIVPVQNAIYNIVRHRDLMERLHTPDWGSVDHFEDFLRQLLVVLQSDPFAEITLYK